MRELNSKASMSAPFACTIDNAANQMIAELQIRIIPGKELVFTLAIDATKVAGSLQTNTNHKVIVGGEHSNHWVPAEHLTRDKIISICKRSNDAKVKCSIATKANKFLIVAHDVPTVFVYST